MAADAYANGMDGALFLDEADPFRYNVLATILKVAESRREKRERRLASYIADEVVKRFK